jgi:DNA-binding MarR family transcriptional regulator
MYNSYTHEVGLTVPAAYVLLLLSSKKGALSTQIAPLLGMEAGSITRLLKSMEEQQLILRRSDQEDKRQVSVYLTEKGRKMRQKAKKIVKSFNEKLEKRISKDSLDQFLKILDQIVGIAENNHFKEKTL